MPAMLRTLYRCCIFFVCLLLIGSVGISADSPTDPFAYFTNVRDVTVSAPDKQNYVTLDASVFQHARPDLGDLRFYAGRTEIPYATVIKRTSTESTLTRVAMLNKGKVGGDTSFLLDVSMPEYDNIRISLSATDFIAQAKLEGANEISGTDWADLGRFTIFDFTKERLGSNFTAHLHTPSRFRYVRITITGPIGPEDVRGASVANVQKNKAHYVALPESPAKTKDGPKTVFEWDAPARVPLDRIQFDVDPAEINFNRTLTLSCDNRYVTTAELSRIHMVRKGRAIDSENMDFELSGLQCKHYKLEIDNGNDQPLRISAMHPLAVERRAYFDPRGNPSLKLYYGDEKLQRPQYDYAKLFEEPDRQDAALAILTPDAHNPAFSGRPDSRPWSEQHPSVLWIAMLVAVGLLGAWALKGFKS